MKVLFLNSSDTSGGAAIAAKRLMNALIDSGIDVNLLVLDKNSENKNVFSVKTSFVIQKLALLYFLWERFIIFIINRLSRKNLFKISIANVGFDVSGHKLVKEADIIHLHWINQGFLSLKSLKKIFALRKPIVWTMHDMWGFTGICHYAGNCSNYTKECGNCHFLKKPKINDKSAMLFHKKKKLFANAPLFVVTCSDWLCEVAKQSELLQNQLIMSIPNPIDIEQFKPCNQIEARQRLKLPHDKKLLLFGAANISDSRKGITLLINALQLLANNREKHDIELVVFGKTSELLVDKMPLPVHIFNYISNSEMIVDFYNAADVFVLPSLEDNLPNTVMEALSCGLPVVAFQIGGVPEMITHAINGYLASEINEKELAKGIEYIIDNENIQQFRINARNKVETTYQPRIIAKQYESLYNKILKK